MENTEMNVDWDSKRLVTCLVVGNPRILDSFMTGIYFTLTDMASLVRSDFPEEFGRWTSAMLSALESCDGQPEQILNRRLREGLRDLDPVRGWLTIINLVNLIHMNREVAYRFSNGGKVGVESCTGLV